MFAILLFVAASFADSTQVYYAQQNADALADLFAQADTRAERLLCRYRLYPLTEDEAYLQDLPAELPDGSARELALLSGLWGYRAARASLFSAIRYGRRAQALLDAAKAKDPDAPFVLLVEGQSLIFKPPIAGRDVGAALDCFSRLRTILDRSAQPTGISLMEARLWYWYALHRLGINRAETMRQTLLAANPPPLYRQFLRDPP